MEKEKIVEINNKIETLANIYDESGHLHEPKELKDWQLEIMLKNETLNEDAE